MARKFLALGLSGAFALVAYVLKPPTPFPDRLAKIPEAWTVINNTYYDLPVISATWRSTKSGLGQSLIAMNAARVPYFVRIWRRELTTITKILDVGCGGGLVTNALAELDLPVDGVDISANSLKEARLGSAGLKNPPSFSIGSAYAIPAADASLDGVVMSDVLEHFHDLGLALAQVHRVLKPGGVFVLDTINRTFLSWIMTIIVGERITGAIFPGTHDWRMYITPDELGQALKDAGFEPGPLSERVGFAPKTPWRLEDGFVETGPDDLAISYLWWAKKK